MCSEGVNSKEIKAQPRNIPTPPNEGVAMVCALRSEGVSTIPLLSAILMMLGIAM